MKKLSLAIAILLLIGSALYAQVGINTTNAQPDPSAGLDVSFTNKGLLPPRVALTAINSALPVTAPAVGLLVYNISVAGTAPYNVMAGYYCWDGTKWNPVATPPGTNPGEMQYWNGAQWVTIPAGSNGQVLIFRNGIPAWGVQGLPSSPCGNSFGINHYAGAVAPVTKSVIYGTVSNIPGETSKCWITSNLGADHQATAVNDAAEASAGWYWQFNLKQGYKHDGTTRTPNTTWITSPSGNYDWVAENDPCSLELGFGWRIPTMTEWSDIYGAGNWGNYGNWFGPWDSGLKLHAAGRMSRLEGSLCTYDFGCRGNSGFFWSSSNFDGPDGGDFEFRINGGTFLDYENKACGLSVRCIRDY